MKKGWILTVLLVLLPCAALGQPLLAYGYETETVTREWETSQFFARMNDLTGVQVMGHGITTEKDYQKFLLDLEAGKTDADILIKANLTREQERTLLDSGALVDLAPYLDAMPNLSELLKAHPQWIEEIALEDGRIASLPQLNLQERQVCVWINTQWIEKLGLAMPNSVEALTRVLEAFQAGDMNGNGKPDERAADLLGPYEMRWLLPFFGIVANDYHVAQLDDGSFTFAPDLPEYRTFAETLRQWQEKGILRTDALTGQHVTLDSLTGQSQDAETLSGILVSLTPYTHVAPEDVMNYQALLLPGPDGNVRWRDLLGEVWNGTFAVTAHCQDIQGALSWVDALYGEDGALLCYAGEEGTDYIRYEDGSWEYLTDSLRNIENIRSETIFSTGIPVPGLYPAEFVSGIRSDADRWVFAESEKVHAVAVRPHKVLGKAEQERADALALTVGELVDKGLGRFVSGETPLDDDNWQSWLDVLHAAGSAELTALFAGETEDR